MKSLFLSLLLVGNTPDLDKDGWALVEPSPKVPFQESLETRDLRAWAVLYKTFAGETFWIAFPEDPIVQEGALKIFLTSEKGGKSFSLEVEAKPLLFQEKVDEILRDPRVFLMEKRVLSSEAVDLFYEKEGKKVWVRIIKTPSNLFILREEGGEGDFSEKFFTSFSWKKEENF